MSKVISGIVLISLNKCSRITNDNTVLITYDITSLYTSVPHNYGIWAISYWIDIYNETIDRRFSKEFVINPIQAGVSWNHIGWWGGTLCPPPFLLYFLSNHRQTWHGSTIAQNLSKTVIVNSTVTSL